MLILAFLACAIPSADTASADTASADTASADTASADTASADTAASFSPDGRVALPPCDGLALPAVAYLEPTPGPTLVPVLSGCASGVTAEGPAWVTVLPSNGRLGEGDALAILLDSGAAPPLSGAVTVHTDQGDYTLSVVYED